MLLKLKGIVKKAEPYKCDISGNIYLFKVKNRNSR